MPVIARARALCISSIPLSACGCERSLARGKKHVLISNESCTVRRGDREKREMMIQLREGAG